MEGRDYVLRQKFFLKIINDNQLPMDSINIALDTSCPNSYSYFILCG